MLVPMVAMAIRPQITERESIKPLALLAKQNRRSNEPVVFLGDLPRIVHGFTFYTDRLITYDEDNHGSEMAQTVAMARNSGSLLCVALEPQLALLSVDRDLSIETLGRQRGMVLFRITANNHR